jgi:hypothetical protein
MWDRAESNRRHTDFQSVALPTELQSLIETPNIRAFLSLYNESLILGKDYLLFQGSSINTVRATWFITRKFLKIAFRGRSCYPFENDTTRFNTHSLGVKSATAFNHGLKPRGYSLSSLAGFWLGYDQDNAPFLPVTLSPTHLLTHSPSRPPR